MKYFYLPACHVIINQHQRNREHANVILSHTGQGDRQVDASQKVIYSI